MKRLRNSLGIAAGKATGRTMKILGRTSTALPGYVAEKIGNEPLKHYLHNRKYAKTILVTGTNGKTTTTMLIASVLRAAGYEVVNNGSGSNLTRGVLTALLNDAREGDKSTLLLEVDEASMPAVCAATKPDIIVVSNIFRDQLDRYGEVDTTRKLLEKALALAPEAELVLCADDPHVARLSSGEGRSVTYFGLNAPGLKALSHDHAGDVPVSPSTGSPLKYTHRYFGHVGKYQAEDGSFKRPSPDVSVETITNEQAAQIVTLKLRGVEHPVVIRSGLLGTYNTYNLAAALAVGMSCGLDISLTVRALQQKNTAFGRQETVYFQGQRCQFLLIKNPTGFNQVIQSFFQKRSTAPVLIVINDNFADGKDVSWLWDAALEDLSTTGRIVVSGLRAYDMALRLEYASKDCEVIEDPMEALREITAESVDEVFILPTYTALLDLRKRLSLKLEHSV